MTAETAQPTVTTGANTAAETKPASAGSGVWFWVAMLVAPLPVVSVYLYRMWQLPHYGYFPFLIAAVAYLAHTRGRGPWTLPTHWAIWLAVALGQAVTFFGAISNSPWLSMIGWVVVAAAALANRPATWTARLLYLAIPLILLIRLPLGYDQILIVALQNWTTQLTSVVLDLLSVPHLVNNNTVTLVSGELLVAEACSGIQSVFTLAFIATLFVVWQRRPWWTTPAYLICAIVLAVAGNVLRVTTIAVFQYQGWTDLSEGWQHAALGYTTLAIAAGLLLSFDNLIAAAFPTLDEANEQMDNPLVRLYSWLARGSHASHYNFDPAESNLGRATPMMWRRMDRPILIGSAVLAVAMFGTTTFASIKLFGKSWGAPASMFADGMIFDAGQIKDLQVTETMRLTNHRASRQDDDPILGRNADLWSVVVSGPEGERTVAQAVVSQSYKGWHELCLCYQNQDFELASRERIQGDEDVPMAFAKFFRNDERGSIQGSLYFGAVDDRGQIVQPPGQMGRLGTRLSDLIENAPEVREMAMIQVWHTAAGEPDEQLMVDLRQAETMLIRQSSQLVRQQLTPDTAPLTDPTPSSSTEPNLPEA